MPEAPRLMPFQDMPFNGDGYAAAEVIHLRDKHGLTRAFETGTCYGSTTLFLADHFETVTTFEIHGPSLDVAKARVDGRDNITFIHGSSADRLRTCAEHGFYFLDAHWLEHCPLHDELKAIAFRSVRPVIMIHDWQVPGTDFGFDRYPGGYPFNLESIAHLLDAIYYPTGWEFHYNAKAEGARRGIIYIEPR